MSRTGGTELAGAAVPVARAASADAGPQLGRIALLIQGDDNYGVGQVARETTALLPGLRCVALTDGAEMEDIRAGGAPVHRLAGGDYFRAFAPSAGGLAALRQLLRARPRWVRCADELHRWCEREGVDVLHGNVWSHYFILGALRRRHPGRYRTIWHTHNFLNLERHFGLRGRFNLWQVRRGADWLLCVSEAVAGGWGRSGVPTRVVHNCVASRHAGLPAAARLSRRTRGGTFRIVGAGRMEWSKGHHVTLEAMAGLRDHGISATLDLFGGPITGNAYCDWLQERIRALDLGESVRLRGFAGDLVARLDEYDIAVQARIDPEPCSLYVLECMARGMAIAASAGGGTPELLRDGREGRLYAAGDSRALSSALASLIREPDRAEEMARAARARCHESFSPSRFARKMAEFYAEVQNPGRVARPIPRARAAAHDLREDRACP